MREGDEVGDRDGAGCGRRRTLTASPAAVSPQARVLMGPEEVLIRGGNVSVNAQLVPGGESQLLPGKGQWAHPRVGLSRAAGD